MNFSKNILFTILIIIISLITILIYKYIIIAKKHQNIYKVTLSTVEDSVTLTGTIHPKIERSRVGSNSIKGSDQITPHQKG